MPPLGLSVPAPSLNPGRSEHLITTDLEGCDRAGRVLDETEIEVEEGDEVLDR